MQHVDSDGAGENPLSHASPEGAEITHTDDAPTREELEAARRTAENSAAVLRGLISKLDGVHAENQARSGPLVNAVREIVGHLTEAPTSWQ